MFWFDLLDTMWSIIAGKVYPMHNNSSYWNGAGLFKSMQSATFEPITWDNHSGKWHAYKLIAPLKHAKIQVHS